MSIVWSVLGILVCGGVGGSVAWLLVRAFELTGIPAALVALVVGMVLAVACWIGLTSLLRVMKVLQ